MPELCGPSGERATARSVIVDAIATFDLEDVPEGARDGERASQQEAYDAEADAILAALKAHDMTVFGPVNEAEDTW